MTEKELKQSLVSQLKNRNAIVPFWIEMVDEFIYLWKQLKILKKGIKAAGLFEEEIYNNSGAKRLKPNPMLKEIRETEKQMLLILEKMKLSTENIVSDDSDDEL